MLEVISGEVASTDGLGLAREVGASAGWSPEPEAANVSFGKRACFCVNSQRRTFCERDKSAHWKWFYDGALSALLYNYYLYVPNPSRNLGCVKCVGCQIRLTRTDLCLKQATSNKQNHPQSQLVIRCAPGYRWLLIENQSSGKTLGF